MTIINLFNVNIAVLRAVQYSLLYELAKQFVM